MKSKMYIVWDYYEDWFKGDEIGRFDSLQKAKAFARHYDEQETDGECSIEIEEYENGQFTGRTYSY